MKKLTGCLVHVPIQQVWRYLKLITTQAPQVLGCYYGQETDCLSDDESQRYLKNMDNQSLIIFKYYSDQACNNLYQYHGFVISGGTYCSLYDPNTRYTCLEDGNILMEGACSNCDTCGPETVTLAPNDCVLSGQADTNAFTVRCNSGTSLSFLLPFLMLLSFVVLQ